jgi:hypothetical protein
MISFPLVLGRTRSDTGSLASALSLTIQSLDVRHLT